LQIHQKSKAFPKDEQFALTSQIRRASKSICANIAEGFVKQSHSKAEFGRFLSIALGSAGEMRVWLRYCVDLGYINKEEFSGWTNEYQTILRMLEKLRLSIQ
jgi:four helix bundle protein